MEQDNTIQQNRSKRFLKAIGLYAIGNLGSKLITFLMVPLYTYFVNPADYGFYDICLTLVLAATPLMTLQLRDGAFRFLINNDDNNQKRVVVSFAYKVLILTTILIVAVGVLLSLLYPMQYLWYVIMLLVVMSFYEVITQMTRGLGDLVGFVTSGIISALGIGIFSIVFVVCFDMGIVGIFLANILARFIALIFVEVRLGIIRNYFTILPNRSFLKRELLKYTIPLMFSTFCWCVMDSNGRLFVQHYLGLEMNGLYAVAFRFATILQTLAVIYFQAWQEMALIHYESKDRDSYFSDMFNAYVYVLSFFLICLNFVLKLNYGWLVDSEYAESLWYIYPMSIAVSFYALDLFVDLGYQCAKDTKRMLPSLIVAVMINIFMSLLLVEKFGVWGVVCSSIMAYVTLFIYRICDMRRYFKLSLYRKTLYPILLVFISMIPFYYLEGSANNIVYIVLCIIVFVLSVPTSVKQKIMIRFPKSMR